MFCVNKNRQRDSYSPVMRRAYKTDKPRSRSVSCLAKNGCSGKPLTVLSLVNQ